MPKAVSVKNANLFLLFKKVFSLLFRQARQKNITQLLPKEKRKQMPYIKQLFPSEYLRTPKRCFRLHFLSDKHECRKKQDFHNHQIQYGMREEVAVAFSRINRDIADNLAGLTVDGDQLIFIIVVIHE